MELEDLKNGTHVRLNRKKLKVPQKVRFLNKELFNELNFIWKQWGLYQKQTDLYRERLHQIFDEITIKCHLTDKEVDSVIEALENGHEFDTALKIVGVNILPNKIDLEEDNSVEIDFRDPKEKGRNLGELLFNNKEDDDNNDL